MRCSQSRASASASTGFRQADVKGPIDYRRRLLIMTTARQCRLRHIHLTDPRSRERFAADADADRIARSLAQTEEDIADLIEVREWLRQMQAERVVE